MNHSILILHRFNKIIPTPDVLHHSLNGIDDDKSSESTSDTPQDYPPADCHPDYTSPPTPILSVALIKGAGCEDGRKVVETKVSMCKHFL